jgi:hypothetical protein
MKSLRILLTLTAAVANLVCPRSVLAADTTSTAPPLVVPQDRDDSNLQHDLRGVPNSIKTLILTFDQTRDRFLRQQGLLLIRLRNASTAQERQQVREQLQANRQDFLNELKGFRDQLRTDLDAVKPKLGQTEFLRIINAAHEASAGGGHRHRGQ